MKNMKKKNQMIITALAIMIAVAGYLNFTGTKFADEEIAVATSGQGVALEDEEQGNTEAASILDISDEDIYAAAENEIGVSETGLADGSVEDGIAYTDIESLDSDADAAPTYDGTEQPGEAVFTSSNVTSVAIVANAKLLKEQTRAKNKETLLAVINSASVSDTQKQTAIDGMIAMTDIAERETAAENLLTAKGFSEVVVSITGNTADVLVNAGELSDANRAQIEDVIQRKTGVAAENIVITPIEAAE